MTLTLANLKPGQSGRIVSIDFESPMAQRLMALGLLNGSDVRMRRRALGGDPLEVEVMGYALSLRRSEASVISIETANA